jgi:hypothetical protein
METTTITPEIKKSYSGEVTPNPLGFVKGETAIIGADTDSPVEVEILAIRSYGANVRETVSGKGWSCSVNCLSR